MRLIFVLFFLLGACSTSLPKAAPLFFGVALDGIIDEGKLNTVQHELDLSPSIVVFYLTWPSPAESQGQFAVLPTATLENIWNSGKVPCVTWEPMYIENGIEVMVPYEHILQGKYDKYITAFADAIKVFNKPVLLRFAHEMNIERYHWGTTKEAYGSKSPEMYRAMYRYIVKRFREHAAANTLWVFSPNAESVPNTSYDKTATWNEMENYYPGDEYIDILGMDGYNWGNTQTLEKSGWNSTWQSFEQVFLPLHQKLVKIAGHKPIFVFETASVSVGGDRVEWLNEAIQNMQAWKVQGLVWFQVNKEQDWKLSKMSPKIAQNFNTNSQDWFTKALNESKR